MGLPPARATAHIKLDPPISFDAISILLEHELLRFPDFCKKFNARKRALEADLEAFGADERVRSENALSADSDSEKPEDILRFELLQKMKASFP